MIEWPSWRYGPNGEAEIFADAASVPEGWADTPAAFAPVDAAPEAPADAPVKRGPGRPRKDAA